MVHFSSNKTHYQTNILLFNETASKVRLNDQLIKASRQTLHRYARISFCVEIGESHFIYLFSSP